jgi:RNA-directed DNA polymerase
MSGTRQKTLGEQLSQTLVAEGRGEALDAEAEDAEPLMAKPAPESPALAEQLMEEVCDRENLKSAWKRVRSNKGSPGVDGMTIDAAKDYLRENWPNIRVQLLEGTYQPQPVKRVEIPKPDGGIRKLGVPCVVDRLIQQAMLQVLQERWDPTFSEHSYGFRPGAPPIKQWLRRNVTSPTLQHRGRSRSRKVLRPSQSRQPDGARRRASVR